MTKMTYVQAIEIAMVEMENEQAIEKLKALKASLEKKSSSKGNRKPSKTQIANDGFKEIIINSMVDGERYTITEMCKTFDFGEELSNQRVSALVTQLKKANLVERIEEKGKAYFVRVLSLIHI